MWFRNLLGWVLWLAILIPLWLWIIYYIFVWIWWCIWFIFAPIKIFFDKKKQKREEEKEQDREREEQWERVSKELKESWFSLVARKKEMTPEEKAEYDKRMAKIKKDKKIVIIALTIIALLMLSWMIISLFD